MLGVTIGWIGVIVTTIIMLLVQCGTANAQTMYEVEYKSQANLLIYEVNYPAQADIKYWVVEYKSQANENKHHYPSKTL